MVSDLRKRDEIFVFEMFSEECGDLILPHAFDDFVINGGSVNILFWVFK